MAVIRTARTKNYTVMSNIHLQDKNLSLKAKGLLSMVLSFKEEWHYSLNGLVAVCKESKTAVKSTMDELKKQGYLKVTKERNEKGQFEYIYTFMEKPIVDNPEVDNPHIENPYMDNMPQLNTNKLNTNKLNTNKLNTNNTTSFEEEFEGLWKQYPNKKGKTNALKAYIKARKNGTSLEDIQNGLNEYIKECELKKTEKQYIKHGSTWFNQQCWLDDYMTEDNNNGENQRDTTEESPKMGIYI